MEPPRVQGIPITLIANDTVLLEVDARLIIKTNTGANGRWDDAIPEDLVRAAYDRLAGTSPGRARTSRKSTENRNTEVEGPGTGPSKHGGGSVSFVTTQERLADSSETPPTVNDLYLHLHTVNHDRMTFIDTRSADRLQSRRRELTQATPEQLLDDEAVYLNVAGESSKGRVYGLGSVGRKKRRYGAPGASTSETPDVVPRPEFNVVAEQLRKVMEFMQHHLGMNMDEVGLAQQPPPPPPPPPPPHDQQQPPQIDLVDPPQQGDNVEQDKWTMNVPAVDGGLLKPDVVEGTDDEVEIKRTIPKGSVQLRILKQRKSLLVECLQLSLSRRVQELLLQARESGGNMIDMVGTRTPVSEVGLVGTEGIVEAKLLISVGFFCLLKKAVPTAVLNDHSIITTVPTVTPQKTGKLILLGLAGSEQIEKTGKQLCDNSPFAMTIQHEYGNVNSAYGASVKPYINGQPPWLHL
ncbi:hypothetical protein Syun_021120 [Stephania yunnanensis]|uniref:Uncharacterized protein n=1 Tax=Stephania yunnanensis TaxID=152371 RepID=A0AAP0NPH7_9MAGN